MSSNSVSIPSLSLAHSAGASNVSIPQIGLGTYLITGREEVERTLKTALQMGYRHIDTATLYGNEALIGDALKKLGVGGVGRNQKEPTGELGLRREDLFITSKLLPSDMLKREDVRRAVNESLTRLQTDYIDLYLVHWPIAGATEANREGMREKNPEYRKLAWDELTQLFKEGKLRAIGVSNFLVRHLTELETAAVKPTVNQCEYHPLIARKSQPILDYCAAHKIVFESFRTFGGAKEENKTILFNIPLVQEIASAHKHANTGKPVTSGQVLLKMCTQQGLVVIPKSVDEQHMRDNLDLFDFSLSTAELESLKALGDTLPKGYLSFMPSDWNNYNNLY